MGVEGEHAACRNMNAEMAEQAEVDLKRAAAGASKRPRLEPKVELFNVPAQCLQRRDELLRQLGWLATGPGLALQAEGEVQAGLSHLC